MLRCASDNAEFDMTQYICIVRGVTLVQSQWECIEDDVKLDCSSIAVPVGEEVELCTALFAQSTCLGNASLVDHSMQHCCPQVQRGHVSDTSTIFLLCQVLKMAHLTADALLFQLLCSLQVIAYHFAISNKGDIGTFSLHL